MPSDAASRRHAAGGSYREKVLVGDSSQRYRQREVISESRGALTSTGADTVTLRIPERWSTQGSGVAPERVESLVRHFCRAMPQMHPAKRW